MPYPLGTDTRRCGQYGMVNLRHFRRPAMIRYLTRPSGGRMVHGAVGIERSLMPENRILGGVLQRRAGIHLPDPFDHLREPVIAAFQHSAHRSAGGVLLRLK